MLVYRVEDIDGYGPYMSPYHSVPGLCDNHSGCDYHPTVSTDKPLDEDVESLWDYPWYNDSYGYRCGFESLDKLLTWFDGWESEIDSAGFTISCYDAPEVLQGEYQLVFNPDTANKVWGGKRLTEILECV